MTAPQPRRGNGEFTFKTWSDADSVTLAEPVDPEERLGIPQDERIGLHYAGTRDIDGDNVQVWSSGNGSYEVLSWEDGHTLFTLDGDAHRVGGPAIIGADGQGDWYRHGTRIAAARPFPPRKVVESTGPHGDTVRFTGDRYDAAMKPAAIARDVRRDLDSLTDVGIIPEGATVTVSGTTRGGDRGVTVTVSDLVPGTALTEESLGYTDTGRQLRDHINDVVQQYNTWQEGPQTNHRTRGFWEEINLIERH